MPLDPAAIARGCAADITQANQLCGLELDRFKQALAGTVHELQDVLIVEGEHRHVDLGHDRAQQRRRLEGAEAL